MAPKRRTRGNRRARRGRSWQGSPVVDGSVTEVVSFSFPVASSLTIGRGQFQSVPSSRAFKVLRAECEVVAYAPGTSGTTPTVAAPAGAAFEMRIMASHEPASTTQYSSSTSGPHVVSLNPRKVHVINQRSADFWPLETKPDSVIIALDGVCIGTVGAKVTGLLRVRIALGPEQIGESCPKYVHVGQLDDFEAPYPSASVSGVID